MSAYSTSASLISATELLDIMDDPEVKIFDVRGRWGRPSSEAYDQYLSGHIAGSVFLDWSQHFLEPGFPLNLAPIASEPVARRSFEALGIDQGDTVVLYDDYQHMFAGRLWWALRYWGFENVTVLNGGWKNWQAHNYPISRISPETETGSYKPKAQKRLIVTLDFLIQEKADLILIDARKPENYQGKPDDPLTGHIPGAINIPYLDLIEPRTGLFKDIKLLEAIFQEKIADYRDKTIVSSCGSGYAGTVVLLALHQLSLDAPLFDGSFALWKQEPSRPIEQGS